MADQPETGVKLPDPVEAVRSLASVAERSQKLIADFLQRQAAGGQTDMDPLKVGQAFLDMTSKMMADPSKVFEAQMALWQDYMRLWQTTAQKLAGNSSSPIIEPDAADRRFKAEEWQTNALFDYLKQSYLLTARWMQSTVNDVDGLDEMTAKKVEFYTRQFVDAMAPTNFAMTNPEVVKATLESGGENLISGLENLIEDLERGNGRLNIKMTDPDAFQVGGNIAVTPGKVIYQTDLMQLIQYAPTTEDVMRRPLLIVPPWINKFYILDLREKNSFIKWATDQGVSVFVISWVNPDESLAGKSFEDYMLEGPLAAMDAIEKATGERNVNLIGYCLGGTLLAATLAVMAAKGDDRVKSATYFTSMIDFAEAGELSVFIDEEQISYLESRMQENGYLEGADMATTFNMLRANDLIWSFVINNYLMGKDPFPFDLLYWNSDSTRMPAAMHSFYLRNMYQKNLLTKPGAITLQGVPVDLSKIEVPTLILSTREDHIAPWKSTYVGTRAYGGKVRFILSASGHIAGVVNPPAAQKYCYWTNSKKPKSPDKWLENAKRHDGSWWPEWLEWLSKYGGGNVPARLPGDGNLKPIEDAPGAYVLVKSGG